MKKKLLALLICLLTFSMLVACGSDDSDDETKAKREKTTQESTSKKQKVDVKVDVNVDDDDDDDDDYDDDDDIDIDDDDDDDDEEETTRKHSSNSSAMFADIDEYLADPTVSKQLDNLISTYEGQGLDVDIIGDYDKITYTYTYQIDVLSQGITLDQIADQLDSYFENAASTMQTSVNQIQALVEVSPITNVIEYYNNDGTLLYTTSFVSSN